MCPDKPLVVIEAIFDADLWWFGAGSVRLCPTLWSCDAARRLVRVVGNAPLWSRFPCGYALSGTYVVPYVAHARSGVSSARELPAAGEYTIVIAAGPKNLNATGRPGGDPFGSGRARQKLRAECLRLKRPRCSVEHIWQRGGNMPHVASAYANATFCLMPPGDTLPRAGIIDAVSVGCIPVFFHRDQQALWPMHWNAARASVLYDLKEASADGPGQALRHLLAMPRARVAALQHAVARSAATLTYRGEDARVAERPDGERDAADLLVEHLTSARLLRRVLAGEAQRGQTHAARGEGRLTATHGLFTT